MNKLNKASEELPTKIESPDADENILVKTIVVERILALANHIWRSLFQKLQTKLTSDPVSGQF